MNRSEPDVSVVIPVYNKADYLAECLRSILDQSLRSIEVICVDDASTDKSRHVVEDHMSRDARIRLIRNAENVGPGRSRNLGIAASEGRYVQFCDADDVLPPDALARLHETCVTDGVELARGMVACFEFDPAQSVLETPFGERRAFPPLEERVQWVPWWHTSYLFSRSFILDNGLEYPDLRDGEDPVFLAAALVRAKLMSMIPLVTYKYRLLPFQSKGRITYSHLRHYLTHADMVRRLFSGVRSVCWTEGYGPHVIEALKWQVTQSQLTDDEHLGIQRRIQELALTLQ
jgi:glycosyltransferase involved in cell wall biosynthesis